MTDDQLIRCFIAAPLSETALCFLAQQCRTLQQQPWSEKVRWINPDNIHLTLRFLDKQLTSQINSIHEHLQAVLANFECFDITLFQPQAFPGVRKPRVIAAPIQKSAQLQSLVDSIDTVLVDHGIKPETRPFRGHITVARVKKHIDGRSLLTKTPDSVSMDVDRVNIYQSVLKPEGAEYHVLHRCTLEHPE